MLRNLWWSQSLFPGLLVGQFGVGDAVLPPCVHVDMAVKYDGRQRKMAMQRCTLQVCHCNLTLTLTLNPTLPNNLVMVFRDIRVPVTEKHQHNKGVVVLTFIEC